MQRDENISRIFDTFREKPHAAAEKARLRREEVEEKFPEIKQIDAKLSTLGMRLFSESMKGGDGLEERLDAIKEENRQLREAKGKILTKHGYPADYTEIKYECDKCRDSGYVGIKMCDCLRAEIIKARYKSSGIGKYLKNMTFDNFSLDYYSDKNRETMEDTLGFCREYARTFDPESSLSLFMMGGTGLGKTHLSAAIAKAVVEKGYDVLYESAPDVIAHYEKERFAADGQMTRRFNECDLLIVDDLGVEAQSKTSVPYVYTLINRRIIASLPTIISTNLTPTQLKSTYDDRIVSRLLGEFTLLIFKGEDIRRKKV